jgi:pimeloyl-ACP methyl ester carboxylesterase
VRKARLRTGLSLHYVEKGRGPALVLLHGGMGDLGSWPMQLVEFSRFFHVIAYSRRHSYPNRNHSVSPTYCVHDDAEDLTAFLDYLGVNKVRLVGTSYGAYVALALALRQPARVDCLVLAEPPVHCCAPPAVFRRFMQDVWRPAALAFEHGRPRQALRHLTDGMWGEPVFDRLPSATMRAAARNARAMQALTSSADPFPRLRREELRRLRLPILLIAGQHAAPIHRLVNIALARLLPHARQATIPHASHGSPRENPGAFNRAVLEFLRCAARA